MFTTSCFIRKNTSELRKKLEELGYIIFDQGKNYPYLRTRGECVLSHNHNTITEAIDCGTNEELFLAIAALRDDSNKHQWITDGNVWHLCNYDTITEEWNETISRIGYGAWLCDCHKATVEELIKHFQDK